MRRHSSSVWLPSLLLVVCGALSWLIYRGFMLGPSPEAAATESTALPTTLPALPPEPQFSMLPIEDFQAILEWPLFSPSRRPPSASETATGAPPEPQVFRVQLGAFKVPENAPTVWQELKRTHPDLLKGLQPDISRVDRGTKGALHLLHVGPLASAQSADELCNSLNERGVDCLVVRP